MTERQRRVKFTVGYGIVVKARPALESPTGRAAHPVTLAEMLGAADAPAASAASPLQPVALGGAV